MFSAHHIILLLMARTDQSWKQGCTCFSSFQKIEVTIPAIDKSTLIPELKNVNV